MYGWHRQVVVAGLTEGHVGMEFKRACRKVFLTGVRAAWEDEIT
jgi:hypothetical protein